LTVSALGYQKGVESARWRGEKAEWKMKQEKTSYICTRNIAMSRSRRVEDEGSSCKGGPEVMKLLDLLVFMDENESSFACL
jgi:hypothetical protein